MDRKEAERLFEEADQFYRDQRYVDSLAILDQLDTAFPNKHRILFPRARCLAKLGRYQEALNLCDTLVNEHEYDKARPLLDKLMQHQSAPSTVRIEQYISSSGFETPPPTDGRAFDSKINLKSPPPIAIAHPEEKPARRFRIKPVRSLLLILIAVAIWREWVVWWLGVGLIVTYFVLKFAIGRAFIRLITVPFRLKGAALRNASADVHHVRRCEQPVDFQREDDDDPGEGPRDWYEIDVTITPAPNDGPFKFWEPGDLALAPHGLVIKKADDVDKTFQIVNCRLAEPEPNGDEDPAKVLGAHRIVVVAGVPPGLRRAQFAYYFETFGEIALD